MEGLPESNTATPLPPPLAGAPTAGSGVTQPNTSNTALFEISDCGSGEPDHPKRTARPCGPGGGGRWGCGRSVGRGNLSHLGSFSPGNNKRGEASPKRRRQLMRWEEEEEETAVPGAGRG